MLSPEAIRRGKLWEGWEDQEKQHREPFLGVCSIIIEKLGTFRKRVLDIGCGVGIFDELLVGRGAEVYGCDIFGTLLKKAKIRVPTGKFSLAEAENLWPYEDNSFDVVFLGNVLSFVDDHIRALKEAVRVCKPDGLVIVLTWGDSQKCEMFSVFDALGRTSGRPPMGQYQGPFFFAEPGRLRGLMESVGLKSVMEKEISAPFHYDGDPWDSFSKAAPVQEAILQAGSEEKVRKALEGVLKPDSENVFLCAIGKA